MGFWEELQGAKVQNQLARIRLEVGELRETVGRLKKGKEGRGEWITEMGVSIDGRRSSQDGRQSKTRLEEITTPGPRIPGSWEELELKVAEAGQKVDGLSKALAKKEGEKREMEERYLR